MSGFPASSSVVVPRTPTGQFIPGYGGNPRGRPPEKHDLPALARKHTIEAVNVLADLLKDQDGRLRLAAARELLDRGYGRPIQPVVDDTKAGEGLTVMHLLAAQHVAELMRAAAGQNATGQSESGPVIDFSVPALE